ncbi:hypothetical protein [Demequina salsinemoris]|uniref:hypothetical protein n=1 Tax=Demequina salsinemoris TaxID=577470 RepID=UPI000785ABAB|nr:hypothetical protein [Demequina salsinemoris]
MTAANPNPALCPSHPHGYHSAPRVNAEGSRHVLRHHSLIGLPKRCLVLEDELLEADRELDFQQELTVIERTHAPVWAVLWPLAAVLAVGVALLFTWVPAVAAVAAGVSALVIERVGHAVQRERQRRIADWRRRVGR